MGKQKHDSAITIISGDNVLVETPKEKDEKTIPEEFVIDFISKHHLNRLWEEFVYEKNHPKMQLSAAQVLAMINLPPEEQEHILKTHE